MLIQLLPAGLEQDVGITSNPCMHGRHVVSAGAARPVFPFTAIVGQEEMKLALILNVIDPKIGGVMIMGDRGTGKSTTIRALADLLPEMKVGSWGTACQSPVHIRVRGRVQTGRHASSPARTGQQLTCLRPHRSGPCRCLRKSRRTKHCTNVLFRRWWAATPTTRIPRTPRS